ncbi:MAG: transglutaminase-like domain-containing protein [Anaerolineales bacterium]|nr:MAG: transglutaminase-like domain-containing protein [Anaerolineales bacterium]
MKKPYVPPLVHWWDWTAVLLLFLLLQTLTMRLTITEWTPSLDMIRGSAWMGMVIGLALGYSTFSRRRARWLSFFYMAFLLPLQWTTIIEGPVMLEEKLLSVGGRLLVSLSDFFSRKPVEDPLFFLAIMTVAFWVLSASAGYQLTKHQNFLAAILPSMIGMLVIQNYDNAPKRVLVIALFVLLALFLLGRLNILREQRRWKDKRVFLSPENSADLMGGMAIAAALLIFSAWTIPPTLTRIDTLRQTWKQITQPWTSMTNRLENAVSALESHTGSAPSAEFYGAQLELGQEFSLSEAVMFTVQAPDLPTSIQPPRYYWRGRVYDNFTNNLWSATGTSHGNFSPDSPLINAADEGTGANFIFKIGQQSVALLYAPARAIWVSRPGSTISAQEGEIVEVLSWNAAPTLLPGETYQVKAALNNPNIEELQAAGTEYPGWVVEKYLQLPNDLSPQIRDLAQQITENAETPYDKARAITSYLRANIEYAPTVPEPPSDTDPLEWVLFKHKQAFCVYYASLEIVMLRSLGIPARMAVGFAEGEPTTTRLSPSEGEPTITRSSPRDPDQIVASYTVRKLDAHAWPEVYFPGIGWVEFEPTGNQDPLDRPRAQRDDASSGPTTSQNVFPDLESDILVEENLPEEDSLKTSATPFSPFVYIIPISLGILALVIFLNRRYALPKRLPALVRSAIERGGVETPNWVLNWERWVKLTPIEKAFDTINFALWQVKQPLPLHATPSERADKLAGLLPEIAPSVKILLDEHQTSLYTSRIANVRKARRAALVIRYQAILARIRHFWTGKYSLRI